MAPFWRRNRSVQSSTFIGKVTDTTLHCVLMSLLTRKASTGEAAKSSLSIIATTCPKRQSKGHVITHCINFPPRGYTRWKQKRKKEKGGVATNN